MFRLRILCLGPHSMCMLFFLCLCLLLCLGELSKSAGFVFIPQIHVHLVTFYGKSLVFCTQDILFCTICFKSLSQLLAFICLFHRIRTVLGVYVKVLISL